MINTIHLLAGEEVKITSPIDAGDGSQGIGYFAKGGVSGTVQHNGETRVLTHGFLSDDENVGVVTPVPDDTAVIYTHKMAERNKVYFYSDDGAVGVVDIISIGIHDHSSIVTGGPAYGTYFTDSDVDIE